MHKSPSFIYAMTNDLCSPVGPGRKYDLFKVGKANNIEKRRRELSRPSGVPEEFRTEYAVMFRNEAEASTVEKVVHLEAARLNVHHRNKREFIRSGTRSIPPYSLLWLIISETAGETHRGLRLKNSLPF